MFWRNEVGFCGTSLVGLPLRHALSGYWSRRINEEHRMVYKLDGDSLLIAQLRYHY
jgi:Txe/YoeB family toxin of toxin-antitoxin system